jgi:adenosylmethionine-8-amino-7-oxononanoate aminotransferase
LGSQFAAKIICAGPRGIRRCETEGNAGGTPVYLPVEKWIKRSHTYHDRNVPTTILREIDSRCHLGFKLSSILHRLLASPPPIAARGDGVYLYDTSGKQYLDASGGAAVSCLGHSYPAVTHAVLRQVRELSYAHTSFFSTESAEFLAQFLIDRAPAGFGRGRVAFLGSGSEAMEAAIKCVRQHFVEKGELQRVRFIARRQSYHGNTLGALSLSGHVGRRSIYQPLLMDVDHVSPCYAYRYREIGESNESYVGRLGAELERTILTLGADTVAAFVAEPVVGATLGCVASVPGYFKKVRQLCDKYGILMIADEVMCGMGRCGSWFAIESEKVTPDLVVIAKGLGAGYQPIGALLASEGTIAPIAAGSGALNHGHTYMGHPVAAAAALAVVTAIDQHDLLHRVRERGLDLAAQLGSQFSNHPHVGDIRGRGLFQAIELVADKSSKRPFEQDLKVSAKIKAHAFSLGLLCYPASGTADGVQGDHVLLAPPYIIEKPQIDEIVDKLNRALALSLH